MRVSAHVLHALQTASAGVVRRPAARRGPRGESVRLVEAARRGDRAAFGALYERYGRMVHGVLLTRVRPVDAEDLTQDVFLIAWRRLRSLRDPAAFGGWLAAIARRRAIDHLRRARDEVELEEAHLGRDGHDPEARAALAALRAVPEAYRETLVLRLVEGMTGPEIAERTGLTPGSVRVNLHRGMKLLRRRLAGETSGG